MADKKSVPVFEVASQYEGSKKLSKDESRVLAFLIYGPRKGKVDSMQEWKELHEVVK